MNSIKCSAASVKEAALSGIYSVSAHVNKKAVALMAFLGSACIQTVSVYAASDETVFERAKTLIHSIYDGLLSITTIVAVICAVIALLFLMFSSNPRTVENSKNWLKRIVIAWLCINALGLIVNTLADVLGDDAQFDDFT